MKREVKKIIQLQAGTFRVDSVKVDNVSINDKETKSKTIRDKLVFTGKLLEEVEKQGEDKAKELSISGTTSGGLWLPTSEGKVIDEENPSVTTLSNIGKLMKVADVKEYDDETYVEFVKTELPVIREANGYLVFNIAGVK